MSRGLLRLRRRVAAQPGKPRARRAPLHGPGPGHTPNPLKGSCRALCVNPAGPMRWPRILRGPRVPAQPGRVLAPPGTHPLKDKTVCFDNRGVVSACPGRLAPCSRCSRSGPAAERLRRAALTALRAMRADEGR
jgi:hypothetical protein